MKIVTPTALKLAPLPGRLNFPKHSVTWIVKGTFDLKANGPVALAEKQTFPTAGEFYPEDADQAGGPRYESDFAYHKPLADLLLVGACYPPEQKPAQRCQAVFRVGNRAKTIEVLGNRRWEKQLLSWKVSEAEPFTRMDLRYENSFGGDKFPGNPVGKGFAELTTEAGEKLWPLPNLEDPACLIQNRSNRPAPAGFGPTNRMWELRKEKLGTYKGEYRKTRWPWFPADFDWRHFNAAPPDMQVEGYLRGDEALSFQNLHRKLGLFETRLPGLRIRCFINRKIGPGPGQVRFEEVEMKLDTLWVDMEAEKLVLLWRGWSPVAGKDYEDLAHVYYVSEALDQPAPSSDQHYRNFLALQAAEAKPYQAEAPPPPAKKKKAKTPDPEAAAALAAARKKEKEETVKKLMAQAAAFNAQAGLSRLSPALQQKAQDAQAKIIERFAENDPASSAKLNHDAQQEEMRKALGKVGIDPDNLPPLSEKAHAEQIRLLTALGITPEDLQNNKALMELPVLLGPLLGKSGLNPENLDSLIKAAKDRAKELGLEKKPKPPAPEAKPEPPPTRESIEAGVGKRGRFEGADLQGLDLSGLDLKGANFAGANLSGARLKKCNLEKANFSKANLTKAELTEANLTRANAAEADFSGAVLHKAILKEADLGGAKLANADLTKAILDGAILEKTDLTGACLSESSAVGTAFCGANMTSASFRKGVGVKADFSKATLSQSDFQEANLTEACVIGAIGHQLNLPGAVLTKLRAGDCDFTGAKLTEATGKGSMWKKANSTGADFRYAWMEGSMFTAACLKQSNLSAANMKFCRFNKANLSEAKLIQMNLFQGNLEQANLTNTDLSGSNLYEAEFLDAILDHTKIAGANIKMTKLEAT